MERNKKIALMTVLILILQLFSPYSILLNTVKAASDTIEESPIIFNNLGVTQKGANKMLTVEIAIASEAIITGMDLKFSISNPNVTTASRINGAANNVITLITQESDLKTCSINKKEYTAATKTFRITTTEPTGGSDFVTNGYIPGSFGMPDIDDNGAGFPAYAPILKIFLKIDDSIDPDNVKFSDIFKLEPITGTLPTGAKIAYRSNGLDLDHDLPVIGTKGFAQAGKNVKSIAVKTNPKVTYEHNDNLDLTNGVLTVTYEDDTTEEIPMTDSEVNISSPLDKKANVNKPTMTVGYKGKTVEIPLTVTDPVQSLAVTSPMTDLEYDETEDFDFTGLQLTATKKSGATEILTSTSPGVSISETVASTTSPNFTKTSADGVVPAKGTQKITFTYEGRTATQTAVVNDTISNIALISQPTKKVYKYGEELNLAGAKVRATLGSGGTADINLPDGSISVSAYSKTTTGTKQHLTVSMSGKTAPQTIDVEAYDYITNTIFTAPTKDMYKYNEPLSVAGGNFRVTWKSGKAATDIPLTNSMVSTYVPTKLGQQELTATHTYQYTLSDGTKISEVLTDKFYIEVENPVTAVKIVPPTTTTYYHGDSLDYTGGSISLTYADGSTGTGDFADAVIKESDGSALNMSPTAYDSTNKMRKTVNITYTKDGVSDTKPYSFDLINKVTGITMHTTPKTKYNVKEALDVTGGEIKVKRQVGTESIIPITKEMVSNFNSDVENTALTLTVSYGENGVLPKATTTYIVEVKDTVTGIVVNNPPSNPRYGEELDLSGTTITVTKGSGTTTESVTKAMLSGYNSKDISGSQTVTVTYGGKTDTFEVTVQDYVADIIVTAPTKVDYKYGDTFSLAGGTVQKVMASEQDKGTTPAATPVTLDSSGVTVSTPNMNKLGSQGINVTYEGIPKTSAFTITITDEIDTLVIKDEPTNTRFGYKENIVLTGGTLTATTKSGIPSTIDMTDPSVTITEVGVDGAPGAPLDLNNITFGTDYTASKTVQLNYQGKSVTVPVTIINKVTGITMKTTPKTEYNVNEPLDVTGGEITVTRQTGTPTTEPITASMVGGFSSSQEVTGKELVVSYGENGVLPEATTTYNINVKDSVTSVKVKNPPTTARYGEDLDLSGTTIDIVRGTGPDNVKVTKDMLSGYDPKDLSGEQTITVTYGGKTDTFKVTVQDYVKDIILIPPTEDEYHWSTSGTLDLTGGSVQKVMASDETNPPAATPVALDDSSVTLSAFVPNQEGTQTITVDYAGKQKSFDVTVIDELYDITVNNAPTTVDYGHEIDLTGVTISVRKDSGTTPVPVTKDMLSTYDSTDLSGKQTVTVTYKGKTDTFDITVNDYIVDTVLTAPSKTDYAYGEELDLSDAVLTKVTASGDKTQTIKVTQDMISGYNKKQLGPQTVTVTYEGKTYTFGVIVEDGVDSISITKTPKTDYLYGEGLDVTGGKITVTRGSGTQEIDMTASMVSGFNPNQIGEQTLTVTYAGKTDTYKVNVEDYVDKIEIEKPSKLVYDLNEALDVSSGKVKVIMKSGKIKETVTMTNSMISGFDSSSTGAKTLTVTYEGKTATFGITVKDDLAGMSIYTLPDKLDYLYGEAMNLKGGSIQVMTASGTPKIIPMNASMISGFTTKKLGKVLVTVTYEGLKAQFYINVTDYEVSATLIKPNKLTYEYGQDLNLKGGAIKIMTASGKVKEQVSLTKSMITGFNSKKVGKQKLTVKYKGYTKTFSITIKDTVTGIALNSAPKKTKYKYSEKLDVTGATIKVIKSSGTTIKKITKDMVSGYNPKVSGYQVIKVTYGGFKTDFVVYVYPKVAPSTNNKPQVTNPIKVIPQPTKKPTTTKPVIKQETPPVEEKPIETPVIEEPPVEEKPVITLGEKDEEGNKPEKDYVKPIAGATLVIALLILLLLLLRRKNTEIYVQENGEFVLGGRERLNKEKPEINLNDYLDGETYKNMVRVVLNKKIAKKLDKEEITVTHREQVLKIKVKYEDKPYEIILK